MGACRALRGPTCEGVVVSVIFAMPAGGGCHSAAIYLPHLAPNLPFKQTFGSLHDPVTLVPTDREGAISARASSAACGLWRCAGSPTCRGYYPDADRPIRGRLHAAHHLLSLAGRRDYPLSAANHDWVRHCVGPAWKPVYCGPPRCLFLVVAPLLFISTAAVIVALTEGLKDAYRLVADAEGRLQTVNGELTHRIRNLFQISAAIVSQSVRAASNRENLERVVLSRLSALSAAQALALAGTGDAPVASVVDVTLRPLAPKRPAGR